MYKKLLLTVLIGFGIYLLSLPIEGYCKTIEVRQLNSFKEIEVSNSINLILEKCTKDERLTASVESKEIPIHDIVTSISGDKLFIFIKDKPGFFNIKFNFIKSKDVTVYLKYHHISSIVANSSAYVTVKNDQPIISSILELEAKTGATLDLALDIRELNINAGSASKIKLSGKVYKASIDASSFAILDMMKMRIENVQANIISKSEVKLRVTNKLSANVSTGAILLYQGDPIIKDIEKSILGKVEKYVK